MSAYIIFEENKLYGRLLYDFITISLHQNFTLVSNDISLIELINSKKVRCILSNQNNVYKNKLLSTILTNYERFEILPLKKINDIEQVHDPRNDNKNTLSYVPIEYISIEANEFFNRIDNVDKKISITEYKVLALLADGHSYKMIASELNISYHTVKTHLTHIYKKLGVNNATGAIQASIRYNIIN